MHSLPALQTFHLHLDSSLLFGMAPTVLYQSSCCQEICKFNDVLHVRGDERCERERERQSAQTIAKNRFDCRLPWQTVAEDDPNIMQRDKFLHALFG